jgi:DNA-binding transcriptional MerR regulator
MRIGVFANLFDVSASTVRYYTKLGLLVPDKLNGQHIFDNGCIEDMENILQWKEMKFPLSTISELMAFNRAFHLLHKEDTEIYIDYFTKQKKTLKMDLKSLDVKIKKIDQLLEQAKNQFPISPKTNKK